MRDVILLTDRLKSAMPRTLSEHRALLPVVEELGRAAKLNDILTSRGSWRS